MSDYNFLKNEVVNVPKRSGFDKSYKNLFTMPVGTIVPALCDEIIPNTKIDLKVALNACLPPLASETFMNCKVKAEAFFVPSRLLYGGFEAWTTGDKLYRTTGTLSAITPSIPVINVTSAQSQYYEAGTLADYLGLKMSKADIQAVSGTSDSLNINMMPFLGYHKVYDDWYRNPLIQYPVFMKPFNQTITSQYHISFLPYLAVDSATTNNTFSLASTFKDGEHVGSLRQRNVDIDYFSTATPNAQAGNASKVTIVTTGSSTDLTISALRAANSVQQFLERNNICGPRYVDYVKAHYNAILPAGVAQRTVFLGSGSVDVYTKGIYQQSPANSGGGSVVPNNPFFTSVGAEYGSANANGVMHLVDNFTAMEHGYLFVMVSLVPKITYSNGVNRMLLHYNAQDSQSDCATPLLQNVGNQPIYAGELNGATAFAQSGSVFGYTDRYSEFMTREDELHGLVRDGYSLESFALQKTLGQSPTINTSFLQIPTTYLDQVAASIEGVSNYGAWVDSYFDYKVAQPLQKYSIPSLQDPAYEHGEEVVIQRGGTHI